MKPSAQLFGSLFSFLHALERPGPRHLLLPFLARVTLALGWLFSFPREIVPMSPTDLLLFLAPSSTQTAPCIRPCLLSLSLSSSRKTCMLKQGADHALRWSLPTNRVDNALTAMLHLTTHVVSSKAMHQPPISSFPRLIIWRQMKASTHYQLAIKGCMFGWKRG